MATEPFYTAMTELRKDYIELMKEETKINFSFREYVESYLEFIKTYEEQTELFEEEEEEENEENPLI